MLSLLEYFKYYLEYLLRSLKVILGEPLKVSP